MSLGSELAGFLVGLGTEIATAEARREERERTEADAIKSGAEADAAAIDKLVADAKARLDEWHRRMQPAPPSAITQPAPGTLPAPPAAAAPAPAPPPRERTTTAPLGVPAPAPAAPLPAAPAVEAPGPPVPAPGPVPTSEGVVRPAGG